LGGLDEVIAAERPKGTAGPGSARGPYVLGLHPSNARGPVVPPEQPAKSMRSTVQVAAMGRPATLVEIEAIAAKAP